MSKEKIKIMNKSEQILKRFTIELDKETYFVDLYYDKENNTILDIVIKDTDGEGFSEFSKYPEDKKIYDTISKHFINLKN